MGSTQASLRGLAKRRATTATGARWRQKRSGQELLKKVLSFPLETDASLLFLTALIVFLDGTRVHANRPAAGLTRSAVIETEA